MLQPEFRRATSADLPAIIAMLADDTLGATREDASSPPNRAYVEAFAAIDADPNQYLLIAELGGTIYGCLQLSFIPGLSRLGAWRGQIESVRIASSQRGSGIGRAMIMQAIAMCRARKCMLIQLTSDKTRPDALKFYENLGFVASHEGFKLAF